jgi:hypothetical protein
MKTSPRGILALLLLVSLLSCGGVDYPSLFLRIRTAPGVGEVDALAIHMVAAGEGEDERFSETFDVRGLDLVAGWVLEIDVAAGSPFEGPVFVAITGLAAERPVASFAGGVTLTAREEVEVLLRLIAASCDGDGDGFKSCDADPGCCDEVEKARFNDPDDDDPAITPVSDEPLCRDAADRDGDGASDCAEALADPPCPEGAVNDATIFPGAAEACDGRDNDCDGLTDEGLSLSVRDGQALALGAACGVGACAGGEVVCDDLGGVRCSTADQASPEGDTADGVDDDCDGLTDEGALAGDSDGDGFTDEDELGACAAEPTAAFDAAIHPGAPEACGDGVDQDCDGEDLPCDPNDADQDGFPAGVDCDDDDADVHPGAPEKCGDAMDQDCDGQDVPCDPSLDDDEDGYLSDVDCDDGDAQVHPGADEACNDVDDDCDGIVDDGNPLDGAAPVCGHDQGECEAGQSVCAHAPDAPAAVTCLGAVGPGEEVCDGLDNDCDGASDETVDLDEAAAGCADQGVCAGQAVAACVAGAWACVYAAVPAHEDVELSCDGLDNDCDGLTDEALTGAGLSGCLDQGVCETGHAQISAQCVGGAWTCDYASVPYYESPEARCDGLDNDCDGLVDEALTYLDWDGAALALGDACGAGVCADGAVICDAVTTTTTCTTVSLAHDELCNGLDDDCDGEADEGFSLDGEPVGAPCEGVGACGQGLVECLDDLASTTCSTDDGGSASEAQDERCDGLDNDCDGLTDEALDVDASDSPCLLAGVCTDLNVVATCAEAAWGCDYGGVEGYEAEVEGLCDDLDNDCDGLTDEDMRYLDVLQGPLPLGAACDGLGACGAGVVECGSNQVITCSTDPNGSTDQATAEICNGLDDDCDGLVDDGFLYVNLPVGAPCQGIGECGEGVVQCVSLGWVTCSTNPDGATPQVAAEICDQLDNDCDGLTDEELSAGGAGASCPDAGECTATNVIAACVDGLWQCDFSAVVHYEAGVEVSCDGRDNDCDGQADEDFTWIDPVSGAEKVKGDTCGAGECGGGALICADDAHGLICSSEQAGKELCDGLDNDCDGLTDEGLSYPDPDTGEALALGEACEGLGECGAGEVACGVDGEKVITCSTNPDGGDAEDTVEVCDALDNDCDGDTDEELTWGGIALGEPCEGEGACGQGLVECAAGGGATTCSTMPDGGAPEDTPEACDGEDDDCDGLTDEELGLDDSPCETLGVCVGAQVAATCAGVGGWVCDYSAVTDWQADDEAGRCDGLDNDCDGLTDEDFPDKGEACDDEAGDDLCADGAWACAADGAGLVCVGDTTAVEACGGGDEDCDGATDEEDAEGCVSHFRDLDLDGHGDPDAARCLCAPDADSGHTALTAGDCDDALDTGAAIHPGADEVCNGRDDDCDGLTDAADLGAIIDERFVADAPDCEAQAGVCAGAVKHAGLCAGGAWQPCGDGAYAAHHAAYEAGVEIHCDALDNDCDGAIDEDFSLTQSDGSVVTGVGAACGVGACANGLTRCTAAQDAVECSSDSVPGVEVCDGVDNDCNGATDADDDQLLTHDAQACELTAGVCAGAAKPAARCVAGAWLACDGEIYVAHSQDFQADVELACDGLDNDCDGAIDEDFVVTLLDGSHVTGLGQSCGVGVCADGVTECTVQGDGARCASEALASDEICDGLDNDCDGQADALDGDLIRPACELSAGVCAGASKPAGRCVDAAWLTCDAAAYAAHSGDYEDGLEASCDGLDNDCDGFMDEDFTYTRPDGSQVTGLGQPCGEGACSGGATACNGASDGLICADEGQADDEVCDGVDNDCDGLTDAADDDLVRPSCERDQGVCAGLSKPAARCVAGGWQACTDEDYAATPGYAEADTTCDGVDDDCDGSDDEDYTPGATTCGVGACAATGELQCVQGHPTDTCEPGQAAALDATCDGVDDDCDGSDDEDFASQPTTCGEGPCEAAGVSGCSMGQITDTCVPDLSQAALDDDTCDQVDDDCDGQIDEDFTAGATTCGVGACLAQGESSCVDGVPSTTCTPGEPITVGVDATCDGVDDDCDGSDDEDWESATTSCGLGACAATGGTTCVAGVTGDDCEPGQPGDEVCSGLDDDCDGLTDAEDLDSITTAGLFEHDQPSCDDSDGVCEGAVKPAARCVAGSWGDCEDADYVSHSDDFQAGAETSCDGLDNDCDGTDDEDFSHTDWDDQILQGVDQGCGTGNCDGGVTQCNPAGDGLVCSTWDQAYDETCGDADGDGQHDDDCDGMTDEYVGAWTAGFPDGSNSDGAFGRLAADGDGHLHTAYFHTEDGADDLYYGTDASGSWAVESVVAQGKVGDVADLTVDGDGVVTIVYYQSITSPFTVKRLSFARGEAGSWTTADIQGNMANEITHLSTAVDAAGGVHLAYKEDGDADDLKYTWYDTSWHGSETIASIGDVGDFVSLALGPDGRPHVAYRDAGQNKLMYGSRDGSGAWSTTTAATGTAGTTMGQSCSLAVDSTGTAHISFYYNYSASNRFVRVVSDTGGWPASTISSADVHDQGTALAVDADDHLHLVFYGGNTYKDLRYAHNRGGSWSNALGVASTYFWGHAPDLVVTPDGDVAAISHRTNSSTAPVLTSRLTCP